MSKVKIQGNASGTGVLTVTAPNTSTDRTITLPDATGTLATTADSVGGANGVDFNDNVKARFGTGNDFAIWHDGSHTRFQNDTGNLNVRADVFNVTKSDDSENIILAEADGDVKLYRNNVIHLETLATGVRVPVGGVLFGTDTASANALDDYEEGTWTATFSNASQSGGNFTGRYVKIGKSVTVWFSNGGGVISGSSGTATLGGLPFTIENSNGNYPVFSYIHGDAITNCNGFHGNLNATTMSAVTRDGTGYQPWVNGSKWVMITGTYEVLG
jgi:hypothetical protein